MKVLVTGATGFLGANLVHHLIKRGDQVRILKRRKTPPTLLEGLPVKIVEGDLTVVSTDLEQAVHDSITAMDPARASLLTVYSGTEVRQHEAEALAQELRERHPDLEVELVPGGQRHYSYLLSLE